MRLHYVLGGTPRIAAEAHGKQGVYTAHKISIAASTADVGDAACQNSMTSKILSLQQAR
jgi:hypothetical protein